jgi:hypothetical protein
VQPEAFRSFAQALPKGTELTNGGQIFTPYTPGGTSVSTPSSIGGTNWWPMSYNRKTHYLYVCGVQQAQLFEGGKTAVYKSGKQFYGSAVAPQATPSGTFTAINASTNRIVWQKQFSDSCYSGSTTTGGNLVFRGPQRRAPPGLQRHERQTASGASRPGPARTTPLASSRWTASRSSRSTQPATRSLVARTATISGSSG